ncbi:unnamed protein product [Linum trigynum]|uniref:Activator of Hsp90 ATPase AHSA1-like N-terminal domain-containing protein n=1 Tax=Linum trigynum TaxID=586398 RepID=A0AAV2CLH5_9ROSI
MFRRRSIPGYECRGRSRSESDCLEWSRNLLSKLLANLTLLDGEGNLFIRTRNIEKVEGEVYVNIHKGKIIPGNELSVALSWEGEAKDADRKSLLKVDGSVDLPYISDENMDDRMRTPKLGLR